MSEDTRAKASETTEEAICFNPVDGTVRSRHPWMRPETVDRAFRSAREAQSYWARLSVKERCRRIRPLSAWLSRECESLAATISGCNGKPLQDAIATEVLPAALATAYYTRKAPRWLRPERVPASHPAYWSKYARIHRFPHGLVGIITPWNYPLGIPLHEIVSALICGNGVVFKTAPETIPVGEALSRGLASLDIPDGLFQHLIMPGPAAGERFLASPGGVDKLCFTGSVPVGRLLAREAGHRLIPISAELGGKDPMIVCNDAPMDRAVNGALWGSLQNVGQACAGIERIYVEADLHDAFLNALAEKLQSIRMGAPDAPDVELGPMTTAQQRDKVQAQLDAAVADGAKIVAQCPIPDSLPEGGFWFPATLVSDVRDGMALMRDENFGPIIAVQKIQDLEEGIRLANQGPYALTASVWTRRRAHGRRIAEQLRAGSVTVNDHLMSHGMPEITWGGPGDSGLGRTHGKTGLLSMTREQNIVDERLPWLPRNPWWFPYSAKDRAGLSGILSAFHGQGMGQRLKGLGHFIQLIPRLFRR